MPHPEDIATSGASEHASQTGIAPDADHRTPNEPNDEEWIREGTTRFTSDRSGSHGRKLDGLTSSLPFTLAFAIVIAASDLLSKSWALKTTARGQKTVIEGFFYLVHRENPGMAFSLMHDWPERWRFWLLSSAAIVGIVGGLFVSARYRVRHLSAAAIGMVIGGAAGNFIDRWPDGTVTDFLHVHRGWFDWPAFNIADMAISIGAVVIATYGLRHAAPSR